MPRAALFSIHARVRGTTPVTWEHPSLSQLWGPRFSVFVVAERDAAVFALGTMPDAAKGRQRAQQLAERLATTLGGRRISYAEAGALLGLNPNALRYAAATGTIRLRWEGARAPTIWTVPAAAIDAGEARIELARRYLHVYGPATAESFGGWAGLNPKSAAAAFTALSGALTPVRTPIGDGWILAADEPLLRAEPAPPAPARLLPSGDAYFLLQGADRELLIPEEPRQRMLWTPRVWPGALLVGGEILGTWRRADATLTVQPWRRLSRAQREAIAAEAESLPLHRRPALRWDE